MNKAQIIEMTHAEEIMRAVADFTKKKSEDTFSRKEIRDQIGVDHDTWMSSYTAIFQGMRSDHPGRAPQVGKRFKKAFQRVEYGRYTLTGYGKELLKEFDI